MSARYPQRRITSGETWMAFRGLTAPLAPAQPDPVGAGRRDRVGCSRGLLCHLIRQSGRVDARFSPREIDPRAGPRAAFEPTDAFAVHGAHPRAPALRKGRLQRQRAFFFFTWRHVRRRRWDRSIGPSVHRTVSLRPRCPRGSTVHARAQVAPCGHADWPAPPKVGLVVWGRRAG